MSGKRRLSGHFETIVELLRIRTGLMGLEINHMPSGVFWSPGAKVSEFIARMPSVANARNGSLSRTKGGRTRKLETRSVAKVLCSVRHARRMDAQNDRRTHSNVKVASNSSDENTLMAIR